MENIPLEKRHFFEVKSVGTKENLIVAIFVFSSKHFVETVSSNRFVISVVPNYTKRMGTDPHSDKKLRSR
jgi:hypothetical protein